MSWQRENEKRKKKFQPDVIRPKQVFKNAEKKERKGGPTTPMTMRIKGNQRDGRVLRVTHLVVVDDRVNPRKTQWNLLKPYYSIISIHNCTRFLIWRLRLGWTWKKNAFWLAIGWQLFSEKLKPVIHFKTTGKGSLKPRQSQENQTRAPTF